ncbi:hypothetical protein PanWU01x14_323070 [Parasponia andersonii]|uniref:Uncharacterized protein n=1 Tax=Parasponia andersonii TaxID=3476 RepID=A0A2P5AKV9_PARAD|nr:hypothetical protein PanWU01x14_323070 [Parasponia andersonii]
MNVKRQVHFDGGDRLAEQSSVLNCGEPYLIQVLGFNLRVLAQIYVYMAGKVELKKSTRSLCPGGCSQEPINQTCICRWAWPWSSKLRMGLLKK